MAEYIFPNIPNLSDYRQDSGVSVPVGTELEQTLKNKTLSRLENTFIGVVNFIPLFAHYAIIGNINTNETDLYSDTLAAGQLANDYEFIDAEYGGLFVSSGTATRQIKIYFAGTAIFDSGALTLSSSSGWTIYVSIIRISSSAIKYMISMNTVGAALSAYTSVGQVSALTLSNTNILKITGKADGVGAATDDISARIGKVGWYAAP